jgi:S-adenosylmethionine/arginine decarboxylase-like enzyme
MEDVKNTRGSYGFELVLDLHFCEVATFSREKIDMYFTDLCDLIDMKRCEVHFWDDQDAPLDESETSPHTKGVSAVCFILTSTIVVHTLELLASVYINIFSCKSFDQSAVKKFSTNWFGARECVCTFVNRTLATSERYPS